MGYIVSKYQQAGLGSQSLSTDVKSDLIHRLGWEVTAYQQTGLGSHSLSTDWVG